MMALDRRQFVHTLGAGAAALLGCSRAPRRLDRIGVQLYTVRADLERDFDGTLARLAAIGFREVEFAGYFGRTPAQVRAAVARAGLTAPGSHVAFETLADFARTAADAAEAGHHWVVVPWVPEAARSDWRRVAEMLNEGGRLARVAGLRFAYHTQAYDFKPVETVTPFDVVATGTDPRLVDLELDVYWAVAGGGDPEACIARYPGRFPLMHFKDAAGPTHEMVDVGAGSIDWKAVLSQSARAGLQHVFVEHDSPVDAFASVRAGFAYLQGVEF
jgi:sugar phosphate isomerase/epimerase